MEIRPYSSDDKLELITLLRENTPAYFDYDEEQDFNDYLDNELEEYYVLHQNSKILACGGINYFPKQRIARLSWDIVKPSEHGKGIGRKLVNYRTKLVSQNPNIERIIIRTSQHANKFYEKMGFKLTKVEKDFWAVNLDLYEMELPILR